MTPPCQFEDGLPYRSHLTRLARRILKDEGLVEDVLQEVHTTGWLSEKLWGDRRPECLKSWLTTVTRRKAITVRRKRQREVPLSAAFPQGDSFANAT